MKRRHLIAGLKVKTDRGIKIITDIDPGNRYVMCSGHGFEPCDIDPECMIQLVELHHEALNSAKSQIDLKIREIERAADDLRDCTYRMEEARRVIDELAGDIDKNQFSELKKMLAKKNDDG